MSSASSSPPTIPSSILIIGSGVFGLSTALALTERPRYAKTEITLLDPHAAVPASHAATTSSVDTTRIVRADYADADYAQLARKAQTLWRTDHWGGQGRYNESGLCLTADVGHDAYVQSALQNVRRLERESTGQMTSGGGSISKDIQELSSPADIAAALRAGNAARGSGTTGYVNPASGWAHAEACMRHLRALVEATGRVRFIVGEAARLVLDARTNRVTGAELTNGKVLAADQTILATGSWTGRLVDLRGVASARAQCIGYMDISDEEAAALKDLPVMYNMGSGLFFFPPTRRAAEAGGWEIKVAQHTFGYTNPVVFDAPVGTGDDEYTITASLPSFHAGGIPPADNARLVQFLLQALPILRPEGEARKQRVLSHSRLCYYLDTESSDWLVCPYPLARPSMATPSTLAPTYPSLFLATGGSGHAFKFLPVLGQRVVDVLDGTDRLPENGESLWSRKWAWPGRKGNLRTEAEATGLDNNIRARAAAGGPIEGEVWCMDGSRGGTVGLRLSEAFG